MEMFLHAFISRLLYRTLNEHARTLYDKPFPFCKTTCTCLIINIVGFHDHVTLLHLTLDDIDTFIREFNLLKVGFSSNILISFLLI